MRKQYDFNQWNQTLKNGGQQTPRVKNKPSIPLDYSRKSITPSKVKERMSTSPLKVPLEKAINKAVRGTGRDTSMQRNSQSRCLGRSSRRQQSSIISLAKKIYYDEDSETQQTRGHPQTITFIRKYFDHPNKEVSTESFIEKMMQQYQTLWGSENAEKIFQDFTFKIADIFGQRVDLRQLIRITSQQGMIGLILRIFKQIKNEQNIRNSNYVSFSQNPHVASLQRSFEDRMNENQSITGIKNVIQQFMQSMYQAMQSQIYAKFNVEMRRMVVKYRQAQKIMKRVNDKITNYADIFDAQSKMRQKQKVYQSKIQELKQQKQKLSAQLQKQRDTVWNQRKERDRLYQENIKHRQNLQKYQNVFLTKAMQSSFIEPSLSRNYSTQSRLTQRPSDNINISQTPQQPFKITIDTHVVHKQNMPPQSKTITTLHNPPTSNQNNYNMPSHSPSKRDSFQGNRYSQNLSNISPSHFTTSRVTNYKPVSPLSPYQSRISKPPL